MEGNVKLLANGTKNCKSINSSEIELKECGILIVVLIVQLSDITKVLLRKRNANQSNYIAITILPINYSRNCKTYTNSRVSWLCIQIST